MTINSLLTYKVLSLSRSSVFHGKNGPDNLVLRLMATKIWRKKIRNKKCSANNSRFVSEQENVVE